ncbi:MAG: hypothetical protein HPY58_09875 [Firmicutes bacterium]|nr:hypothetical protein [Bacillota bacterium]
MVITISSFEHVDFITILRAFGKKIYGKESYIPISHPEMKRPLINFYDGRNGMAPIKTSSPC